jgi:hypothetical protein
MAGVPVVWIAQAPQDGVQAHALRSWGLAHGVETAFPAEGQRKGSPDAEPGRDDARVADDVEATLDRARDAIAARDADAADSALSAAESGLRAHPELPQAAWLMAEVERTRASRWRRISPPDLEAATRAWLRAEALDGGRAPGLGEEASASHPLAATLTIRTVPDGAVAWLDGALLENPSSTDGTSEAPRRHGQELVATHAGPHVLALTLDGSPSWARWIDLPAGPSDLVVTAAGTPPCSASDLARASIVGDAVVAGAVRCEQWIAVAPGSGGGAAATIRVARCGQGRCGLLLEWSDSPAWSWAPPPERAVAGWPAWATWGLVGAGAAIVAGVVVVASGALQPGETQTLFVGNGIRKQ